MIGLARRHHQATSGAFQAGRVDMSAPGSRCLDYAVPADRYQISARPYPDTLPEITYADDAQVRIVGYNGTIRFAGYRIQVGAAFRQLPVGVVATATDGVVRVQFAQQHLGHIDLRTLDKQATRCPLCP